MGSFLSKGLHIVPFGSTLKDDCGMVVAEIGNDSIIVVESDFLKVENLSTGCNFTTLPKNVNGSAHYGSYIHVEVPAENPDRGKFLCFIE